MTADVRPARRRLDGWKSIAAYFGRDRSTVMRWAAERALPVHRVPGGKQGSVFAYEDELASWVKPAEPGASNSREQPAPTEIEAATPTALTPAPEPAALAKPAPRFSPKLAAIAVAAVAAIALTVTWAAAGRGPDRAGPELPRDASVAADYIAARDAWARRTPADLDRALGLYQSVAARQPDFAPAYAGLAETWLIRREYGDVGDEPAYNAAHTAALKAISLDPDLPAAHRAMGFIHYWRENDGPRAFAAFERALELDDTDALSHFWFANVLADAGRHEAARRAYDRARLLAPGSRAIEVESACAEWQAGRDNRALTLLNDLARRYPDDATIHNCLAWLHISRGDIAAFAEASSAVAEARGEPALLARASALEAAVARDPKTAHRVVTDDLRREIASGVRRGRETPAFYASSMGDRAELVALLTEASSLGEQWYSTAITSRIAARWRGDAEVEALLARVRASPPS